MYNVLDSSIRDRAKITGDYDMSMKPWITTPTDTAATGIVAPCISSRTEIGEHFYWF